MKIVKNTSFIVGVVYFAILLSLALWVRDIPNQPDAGTITLAQLIKTSLMGDPGFFATAAIDIAKHGWVSGENVWILNLWPPGFILLEAGILKIFGHDAPVILLLQILAAGLFSIVLLLLYRFMHTRVSAKVAFVLPLLIFVFPVSRVFLLQPTGISLGESFSIGFFLIFIILAVNSIDRNSLYSAFTAGIFLALSAYFRSQFEIFILALTGWGILLLILYKFTFMEKHIEKKSLVSVVKTFAITLFIAHALTFPWRAYHWINQGSPQWVYTSSVTFGNSVMTSEHLEANHGGFVVDGGGNLVCRIDPTTCGDTANSKELFIKTFLENPVEWYSFKINIIGKYWFSSITNWGSISAQPSIADIVVNSVLLLMLVAVFILLFTRKVRSCGSWLVVTWICASLYSSYFLIFTVQQFEARYFYFPKIASIVILMIICGILLGLAKDQNVSNSQMNKAHV